MSAEWPRLLLLDPTAIGSLSATGQFKQMLFRAWPRERLFEATIDPTSNELAIRAGGRPMQAFPGPERALALIDAFAPEAVYLRPELYALGHFDFIVQTLPRLKAPTALHIMDDWLSTDGPPQQGPRAALLRVVRYFVKRSALHFTDGPAYVADLGARLGGKFRNLLNGADLDLWSSPLSPKGDTPFTLTHMGNYDQLMSRQAILDIAGAVDALQDEFAVRLDVHLRDYAFEEASAELARYRGVRVLRQSSAFPDYVATLRRSDVNLYAYGQDAACVRYMGKGIPNKTCELLAAGKPILAYAHAHFSGLNYLRDHGAAVAVTRRADLLGAIRKLHNEHLGDTSARNEAAAALLARNHDAAQIRTDFVRAMRAMPLGEVTCNEGDAHAAQEDWRVAHVAVAAQRELRRIAPRLHALSAAAQAAAWSLENTAKALQHAKIAAETAHRRASGDLRVERADFA